MLELAYDKRAHRKISSKKSIDLITEQFMMQLEAAKTIARRIVSDTINDEKATYDILTSPENYTEKELKELKTRFPDIYALESAIEYESADEENRLAQLKETAYNMINIRYKDFAPTILIEIPERIDDTIIGLQYIYPKTQNFFYDYESLRNNQDSKESLLINGIWITSIISSGTVLSEINSLRDIEQKRKHVFKHGGFPAVAKFNNEIEKYMQERYKLEE